MTAAEVIRAGMELPPAEREEVAYTLLESIDSGVDQAEVDAAWTTAINDRIDDIRRGRAKMLTRDEMDAFLDERRSPKGM